LSSNTPTSEAIIGPARPAPTPDADQFPRLLRPELAGFTLRRGWNGTVANTLLEMPWLIWSAFDILVISIGLYLSYYWFVRPGAGASWVEFGWSQTWLVLVSTTLLSGMVFGLYEQQTLLRRSRTIARSMLTIGAAVILTYIVIAVFMYSLQSRRVLFLAAAFYLAVCPVVRLMVCWSTRNYNRRFLIVGTDRKSLMPPTGMGEGVSQRYRLVGYISTDRIEVGREISGHHVLGTIDSIERICIDHNVDEVVVGPISAKNPRVLDRTLSCLKIGCRVTNLSTFYEEVLSEVPLSHLEPNWFLFADLKHYREAQLIMKRAIDIIGSIIGLILTVPFWPLIALLVKLDSSGSAFYSQQRVGLNGRVFWLYKFRTMKEEAERDGHTWAARNDPRVTRVGWYLRKTRIDELPQLWNILLGHMSIVGPRPERPEFVDELAGKIRFYHERHLIKPGLTGWAQINYRYGASVEDAKRKLQLDLWYLKHMAIELDLSILLRTLGTICLGSR